MTNTPNITIGTQIYTDRLKKPYVVGEQIADDMWSVFTTKGTASVSFNGRDWYVWPSTRGVFPRQINVTGIVIPTTVCEYNA
jgi:hypothetical protein